MARRFEIYTITGNDVGIVKEGGITQAFWIVRLNRSDRSGETALMDVEDLKVFYTTYGADSLEWFNGREALVRFGSSRGPILDGILSVEEVK